MTTTTLTVDQLLANIGWTSDELATRLDISTDTVRQWRRRRRDPPRAVIDWLAQLAECHDRLPEPAGWSSAGP